MPDWPDPPSVPEILLGDEFPQATDQQIQF